jgi:hypothetical protein
MPRSLGESLLPIQILLIIVGIQSKSILLTWFPLPSEADQLTTTDQDASPWTAAAPNKTF